MSSPRSSEALDVLDPVRKRDRDLLDAVEPESRTWYPQNSMGFPLRQIDCEQYSTTSTENCERRARREDVGPAGEVLLQHVVLEQDPEAVWRVTRATLRRR